MAEALVLWRHDRKRDQIEQYRDFLTAIQLRKNRALMTHVMRIANLNCKRFYDFLDRALIIGHVEIIGKRGRYRWYGLTDDGREYLLSISRNLEVLLG